MASQPDPKQFSLNQLQFSPLFNLSFKCIFAAYLIIPAFMGPIIILIALVTGNWSMVPMFILIMAMQSLMFPFMVAMAMTLGAWIIKKYWKHKGQNIMLVFDAQGGGN